MRVCVCIHRYTCQMQDAFGYPGPAMCAPAEQQDGGGCGPGTMLSALEAALPLFTSEICPFSHPLWVLVLLLPSLPPSPVLPHPFSVQLTTLMGFGTRLLVAWALLNDSWHEVGVR